MHLQNRVKWYLLILAIAFIAFLAFVSKSQGQTIIDKDGHPHAKRQGRTQEPKIIIDTLRMSSGVGTLPLSKTFKKNQMTTAPTDPSRIYPKGATQIMDSVTDSVHTYAFVVNRTGDTITVVSSSSNDSSLVSVELLIK